jgi:hypothetical protein
MPTTNGRKKGKADRSFPEESATL